MTDRMPVEVTNLDRYGSPALPWSRPRDLLAAAPKVGQSGAAHFLGTSRPDRHPGAPPSLDRRRGEGKVNPMRAETRSPGAQTLMRIGSVGAVLGAILQVAAGSGGSGSPSGSDAEAMLR